MQRAPGVEPPRLTPHRQQLTQREQGLERRRLHDNFPLPVAEPRCGPIWFRWQIGRALACSL